MTTEREKLIDKIRALMSKTVENGCTQEEALAALAKAQAMMDAYEVSDEELRLTKEEKAVFRREPKGTKDPHNIKMWLVRSVANFAGCKAWRAPDEDVLVFCGMRTDAQFATWLLDHLATFVMGELTNHLMTDLSTNRRARNAVIRGFVSGCTRRISQRLDELNAQSKPATENSRALVVVKGQAIADRMKEAGIQLQSQTRRYTVDPSARAAGTAAGDRASFGRPVSGNQGILRIGGR